MDSIPQSTALKTWERNYERAKAALFKDFQLSAVQWPGILWHTSTMDGVNPSYDLTETISRNLLYRMNPYQFDKDIILSTGGTESLLSTEDTELLASVRRVLHQHAVLPVDSLYTDVTMPGDFFWENGQQHPPATIDICLTPACDLVARGKDGADGIRMFMVRASLVQDNEFKSKAKIRRMIRAGDTTTSVLLHHLVPEDAMYSVRFKDWCVTTWGEVKNKRRGRLLEPYVTMLQQRNALFSQRQGVPCLPKNFYKKRDTSG